MNSNGKYLFVFREFVWFPLWVFSTDRASLTTSLVSVCIYSNNAQKQERNKPMRSKTEQDVAIVTEVDISIYHLYVSTESPLYTTVAASTALNILIVWCLTILIQTRSLTHITIRQLHRKRNVHVKMNSMQRRLLNASIAIWIRK